MEDTKKMRPSKSTKQSACNSETEAAYTGLAWVYTRSSVYILWLPVECFNGIPECGNECVPESCTLSRTLFLMIFYFVQFQCVSFSLFYLILLHFISFYFIIIPYMPVYFLRRDRRDGSEWGWRWGEGLGGEAIILILCEKEIFSIKEVFRVPGTALKNLRSLRVSGLLPSPG